MIKVLIISVLLFVLVPGALGHTEPPDKGPWTIDDDTTIENRTVTLTGNLKINDTGNLTLINSTIYFNSPHEEPLGVIVNEGGRLMASDLDGSPGTGEDRTVFSATVPSSRMRFYAKPGSSVDLHGVEFHHVGTRIPEASDPKTFAGIYCDGASVSLTDVHISNTYWGLILNGTSAAEIHDITGSAIDFTMLRVLDSEDIEVNNLTTVDHTGDPAVLVSDCNGTVTFRSPTIDSIGECLKILSSADVWTYDPTFNSSTKLFWVERSNATIVNMAPESSDMTVLVDSWVDVMFQVRIEVLNDPDSLDPVSGAVVNITSCDPEKYQCDITSTKTGGDGLTPTIMVPIAYLNESSTVHQALHRISLSTEGWTYENDLMPEAPGTVSYIEGEGVPYYLLPVNGPEVAGLVRRATNLTVSVSDLIGKPAIGGNVIFIITSPADHGLSFSMDETVLSTSVPVVNGFATASVHTTKEVENEEVRALTTAYVTSFYLDTVLLYPVLAFDDEVETEQWVSFDASGSEGVGLTYLFDFGDGTDSGWMEDPRVRHTYRRPGTYVVRLRVRNEDGLTQDSVREIKVTEETSQQPDLLLVVGGAVLVLGLITIGMAAYRYHRNRRTPPRESSPETTMPSDRSRMAVKWYDRGTLMAKENIEEAIGCFEKALQLNPNLSRAHYNLGLLLLSQGDLASAREMFVHALSNDPGMTEAQKALDALERSRHVLVKR